MDHSGFHTFQIRFPLQLFNSLDMDKQRSCTNARRVSDRLQVSARRHKLTAPHSNQKRGANKFCRQVYDGLQGLRSQDGRSPNDLLTCRAGKPLEPSASAPGRLLIDVLRTRLGESCEVRSALVTSEQGETNISSPFDLHRVLNKPNSLQTSPVPVGPTLFGPSQQISHEVGRVQEP